VRVRHQETASHLMRMPSGTSTSEPSTDGGFGHMLFLSRADRRRRSSPPPFARALRRPSLLVDNERISIRRPHVSRPGEKTGPCFIHRPAPARVVDARDAGRDRSETSSRTGCRGPKRGTWSRARRGWLAKDDPCIQFAEYGRAAVRPDSRHLQIAPNPPGAARTDCPSAVFLACT